jgi:hypothetical protein
MDGLHSLARKLIAIDTRLILTITPDGLAPNTSLLRGRDPPDSVTPANSLLIRKQSASNSPGFAEQFLQAVGTNGIGKSGCGPANRSPIAISFDRYFRYARTRISCISRLSSVGDPLGALMRYPKPLFSRIASRRDSASSPAGTWW